MTSKRNKTIFVDLAEIKKQKFSILPSIIKKAALKNKFFLADVNFDLKKIPNAVFDLIIADPPYNIGKNFGLGSIKMSSKQYDNWCQQWIRQCQRILKPTGSIYICIDWQHSSIIEKYLNKFFVLQNRITWKRDKGRGAKKNWKNNLEDIWFATSSKNYTFNLNEVKIKKKVIAPYVDKNGKAKDWQKIGKEKFRYTHPANIWTDLTVPFWSMAENTEHPTQKPEKLIARIILASSNKNDLVFDPFLGSGTTAIVAKQLKRNFCGFEIDKKFYTLISKRFQKIDKSKKI